MNKIIFILMAGVLGSGINLWADSDQRGVWMWQSGGVYGSLYVISTPLLRTQHVNWLQYKGIDRVYGSFGNFVGGVNEPNVIAWNEMLDGEGIESHLLLGGSGAILDDTLSPTNDLLSLLNKITSRYVDFNASLLDPAQRFDGIHLDLEPQQLSEWDWYPADLPARLENRRQLYLKLRDTYAAIRAHLVSKGVGSTPLYADLNDWVDKITPSTRFMWQTAGDRADYFDDISAELDGVSLMSYELPTFSQISSRVGWETSSITGMTVRVALNTAIGVSNTWPNVAAFWAMADQVEDTFGDERGIDIHSYAGIRSQYVIATVTGVSVGISIGVGVGVGPVIGVATFVGEKSADLVSWSSTGVDHVGNGGVTLQLPRQGKRGFYRIGEYGEDFGYKDRVGTYDVNAAVSVTNPGPRMVVYQVTSPAGSVGDLPLVVLVPDVNQGAGMFGTLAERLASWGAICVTVVSPTGLETNSTDRAMDLSSAIDQAVAGTLVPTQTAGRIDSDRIAVIGQGLGSTTALKLVGLEFDPPEHAGVIDLRVKLVVAISPQGVEVDGLRSNSWELIDLPVMVMSGNSGAVVREQVYAALGRGYQLDLDGAVDNDFTDVGIGLRGDIYFQWYAQVLLALLDGDLNDVAAGRLWMRAQSVNRLSGGTHALDWKNF